MNIYNLTEVDALIYKIFKTHYAITAIGNHQLKRNAVYLLKKNNHFYVFKLYKKPLRAVRERICLELLKESTLLVPQILNHGSAFGYEWLLESYLQGTELSLLSEIIPFENLKHIYFDLGEKLSVLHHFKTFNHFGIFENQPNFIPCNTFKSAFQKRLTSIENTISIEQLPDHTLLQKSLSYLNKNLSLLDTVQSPTLCHNDYDPRNILVSSTKKGFAFSGIIDFEQSMPWDKDLDFISLSHKILDCHPHLKKAFFEGYGFTQKMNMQFETKKKFYLVYQGTMIASFAYKFAPHYYHTGILLIKNNLT